MPKITPSCQLSPGPFPSIPAAALPRAVGGIGRCSQQGHAEARDPGFSVSTPRAPRSRTTLWLDAHHAKKEGTPAEGCCRSPAEEGLFRTSRLGHRELLQAQGAPSGSKPGEEGQARGCITHCASGVGDPVGSLLQRVPETTDLGVDSLTHVLCRETLRGHFPLLQYPHVFFPGCLELSLEMQFAESMGTVSQGPVKTWTLVIQGPTPLCPPAFLRDCPVA